MTMVSMILSASAHAAPCDLYITYFATVRPSIQEEVKSKMTTLGYNVVLSGYNGVVTGNVPEGPNVFKLDAIIREGNKGIYYSKRKGKWKAIWAVANADLQLEFDNPIYGHKKFEMYAHGCQELSKGILGVDVWGKETELRNISLRNRDRLIEDMVEDPKIPTCEKAIQFRAERTKALLEVCKVKD